MSEEINDVPNSVEASYQLGYRQGKADGYELHKIIQEQLKDTPSENHYTALLLFMVGFIAGAMFEWLFSMVFM